MKTKNIFLSCKIFEDIAQKKIDPTLIDQVIFMDLGLHSTPKKLTKAIQEQLDVLPEPGLVILGFGLCGNGLRNINAGSHTLIVPKAHDCIPILMGSLKRFQAEFSAHPDTYYLTKGWLEVGTDPLSQYETLILKYDLETVEWMMNQQFQNYRRLIFLSYSQADLDYYRPRALQIAEYCKQWNMEYQEMLGDETMINQLLSIAAQPDRVDENFIVIKPGETLTLDHFIQGTEQVHA